MKRLHRYRLNKNLRDLLSEINFTSQQLIQPIFIKESLSEKKIIPGLENNFTHNLDSALIQIEKDIQNSVSHFILFFVPHNKKEEDDKNFKGFTWDFATDSIQKIKKSFGDKIFLWSDICLCSYTKHGHCHLFNSQKQIDLTKTLEQLGKMALTFAHAGIDGLSPSDMMDGRVKAIRNILDQNNFPLTPIMSYSTKFASNFYGPFRHAADSYPQFGDRRQYQIDVRNRSDAIRSSIRCMQEGADLLMVKPGMTSIDLINPIKKSTKLPTGAYQVSGEYASLYYLARNNLINLNNALLETWYIFKRAGAQFIITYGARKAKGIIKYE